MPLILYFDDFETCNPLGSHAGIYKLGAIYFTIASVPPKYASRIENIFLAMLFHSQDRTQFGNRSVFNTLLQELKQLETKGLSIELNGTTLKVFFVVVLIIGGNLGIHSIFGYPESFLANYCCRFCTENKDDIKKQINLKVNPIRQLTDYKNHVENKKVGIKEECIWNDLDHFHVYVTMNCDIMHDLFEGVYRYDMALIIQHFIENKYFSFTTLNSRIKYFPYNNFEQNKPPLVTKEHLANGCIIVSASEMLCLVRNLNIIIGDLISEENKVWQFYLVLKEINDIVTLTQISSNTLQYLKYLISEHHDMYLSLFNSYLKPKHHFLLHYPDIITQIGPLMHVSCMRFEAKHKELKKNATNVQSRRNLPLTLAKKNQLNFLHRCMSKVGLSDKIKVGKILNISAKDTILDIPNVLNLPYNLHNYYEISWFEKNGIRFNKFNRPVFH
ncbi:uncharacterized protein LOC105276340 [Ooceraea biroi]|uniref:uncharacterized protein LOC105276340 n=1 Tax=Ooceraea biroi TaxID=2015173 RepID=UPI000F084F11|nr:uncharacterized protein LOC105276340 [Ooceraea biroi]